MEPRRLHTPSWLRSQLQGSAARVAYTRKEKTRATSEPQPEGPSVGLGRLGHATPTRIPVRLTWGPRCCLAAPIRQIAAACHTHCEAATTTGRGGGSRAELIPEARYRLCPRRRTGGATASPAHLPRVSRPLLPPDPSHPPPHRRHRPATAPHCSEPPSAGSNGASTMTAVAARHPTACRPPASATTRPPHVAPARRAAWRRRPRPGGRG